MVLLSCESLHYLLLDGARNQKRKKGTIKVLFAEFPLASTGWPTSSMGATDSLCVCNTTDQEGNRQHRRKQHSIGQEAESRAANWAGSTQKKVEIGAGDCAGSTGLRAQRTADWADRMSQCGTWGKCGTNLWQTWQKHCPPLG